MRLMSVDQKPLVYGIGLNDSISAVVRTEITDGKRKQVWMCPYYRCWKGMLFRCYGGEKRSKSLIEAYRGVVVCSQWLRFSNFKVWMEKQDWDGNQLDKDMKSPGCKEYSPSSCVFLPSRVNSCVLLSDRSRGNLPAGVRYTEKLKNMVRERTKPYSAQISGRLFGRGYKHLGYFKTPFEAHLRWQCEKLKHLEWLFCDEDARNKDWGQLLARVIENLKSDILKQKETVRLL